MEKLLYKFSSHIIILAKGNKKLIKEKGGKNITWLPNGPDLKIFKQSDLPKKSEIFSFKNPFKLYYLGAHGQANALDVLVDAARILKELPIEIILVGDGPEKQYLMHYAKQLKNVIFLDPIPKAKIPTLMKDADAILLTLKNINLYRYGVSPNKLYDAYAIGRPVITNVMGDVNIEVNTYKLGFTAQADSPESLALAIKKLFNTPISERQKMALRGRSLAEKIYSREKIIDKFNKLLIDIIN